MATRKTKKPKYLSEYEENCIWMSYRYCIGRHTIAAHHHAADIAAHAYNKLEPERQSFMAFDIRREISESLRFSPTNFTIELTETQNAEWYNPLQLYIEGLKFFGITTQKEIERVKSLIYNRNHEYEIVYHDGNTVHSTYSMMDIDDLIIWSDLASLFDKKCHKIATVKHPETGEISEIEVYRSYTRKDYHTLEYEPVWRSVESNLVTQRYLIDDTIIKLENIN